MMPLQVPEITAFLQSRHVQVLDEWTVECLDWLQQDNQGQNVTPNEMKQYVYDQWLDSDLEEIALPVLPPGIAPQRKTQLTGNYALQINSIQDVSVPAYGQLVKLQGKENENALVSATQSTQPLQNKFEQKSNRMLMLQLTDGHQTLEGMEYQPISHLSVDTLPGTKILVHGSVQCRLGVLMLTANNVRVLGGDVESLAETNSKIQILSRALGLDGSQQTQQEQVPITSNPRQPVLQDYIDLTGDTSASNANNPMDRNKHNNQAPRVDAAAFGDEDGFFSDDLGGDLDALMLNEIEQIEEMDQIQRLASSAEEELAWPADDEDIDEMWLEQVEQTHGAQVSNPPGPNTSTENQILQQYSVPLSSHSHKDIKDVTIKTEKNPVVQGNISRKSASSKSYGGTSTVQTCAPKSCANMHSQDPNIGDHLPNKSFGNSSKTNTGDCSAFSRIKEEPGPNRNTNFSSKSNPKIVPTFGDHHLSNMPSGLPDSKGSSDRKKSLDHQVTSNAQTVLPETKPFVDIKQKMQSSAPFTLSSESTRPSSIFQNTHTGGTKPAQATGIAARIAKDSSGGKSATSFTANSSVTARSHSSVLEPASSSTAEEGFSAAKRRRFHSNEGGAALSVESSPFITLSSVMGRIQSREVFSFTIKGFIVTLISPLSRNDGCWSISAKVSDKTASLDVNLSNEVLTGLIGFSVPEMMQIKKTLKTTDPRTAKERETKLRQGLAQCQKSLIDMHCAMTIQVTSNQECPCVTSVGATDPADLATNFREVPNKS